MRQRIIWLLLAVWAVLFAMSGLQILQPPEGDSFTRGLNRISGFVQYQGFALVFALILLGLRGQVEARGLRRLMLIPVLLAVAVVIGTLGVIGLTMILQP